MKLNFHFYEIVCVLFHALSPPMAWLPRSRLLTFTRVADGRA